jgi:phytoene synthase
MAGGNAARADDIAYLAALVRANDRARYYATLFAPPALRAGLFALYGFAAEIAQIPDRVSDATLGEMRLRWWEESLARSLDASGEGDGPALRALAATAARWRLPPDPFAMLIEARGADLYSDAPATITDLEARLGATESALFQMAAVTAGAGGSETADAAGHAGVAYGLACRLATFAADRTRGRAILPADILARAGVSAADVFVPSPLPGVARSVAAVIALARAHLRDARTRVAALPPGLRVVFLPLAVTGPLLARAETLGPAILQRPAALSDLEMLVRTGWARISGFR